MSRDVVTIREDASIKELADLFLKRHVGGAPVVNEKGDLVGVVTEGDLVVKDARIHFPTYIHLLDSFIYLPGSVRRYETEFKKLLGQSVKDVMTTDLVTATEDTSIEEIATLMVDRNISRVPVVDRQGKLTGIVTKHDIVQAISKGES